MQGRRRLPLGLQLLGPQDRREGLHPVDKRAVLAELRQRIAAELSAAIATQKEAQAAATHVESRPESDKDTRATEGSYLARGLAMRVEELSTAQTRLAAFSLDEISSDVVAVGTLVEVSDDRGGRRCYFIAPAGAGEVVEIGGVSIAVITPKAPLCRALLGKEPDDDVSFVAPGGTRELVIERVS